MLPTFLSLQAKNILRQRIKEDQFLDLVTVETEVHSVCKELYRLSQESLFHPLTYYVVIFCRSWSYAEKQHAYNYCC